jgi:hypothetical protein
MNPLQLMKIKGMWEEFAKRHPKFPMFLNAVVQGGVTEDTIIEISVKKPDGKEYATNLKISKEDKELFAKLKEMK